MRLHLLLPLVVLACSIPDNTFFVVVAGKTTQTKVAKVKKRDGQIVEGVIKGVLVQKGKLEKTEKGEEVKYYLINGKDVEMIDEQGVHLTQGSPSVKASVSHRKTPPSDIEVVTAVLREMPSPFGSEAPVGIRIDSGEVTVVRSGRFEMNIKTFGEGNSLLASGGGERPITLDELLGTIRMEGDKASLTFTLEVTTEKGVVVIPIKEIIEFKE